MKSRPKDSRPVMQEKATPMVSPMDATDKVASKEESQDESPVFKPKLQIFPFCAFLIFGCVDLLGWNAFLNSMNSLFTTVYGINDQTVTVTAAYSTALAAITFVFVFVNVVTIYTLYIGLVLAFLISLGLGLTAQFASVSHLHGVAINKIPLNLVHRLLPHLRCSMFSESSLLPLRVVSVLQRLDTQLNFRLITLALCRLAWVWLVY